MKRYILFSLCIVLLFLFSLNTNAAEYKGASAWAIPELDKAAGYHLITDRIKENMSKNITREEFAELAVRFYEAYTGKEAKAGNTSFTDTTNIEVLKAANLGLTAGIGEGKFGPKQLVTREQIATMLVRALKVVKPDADYSLNVAMRFTDDNLIKSWAAEGVYYCSRAGIVKGIANSGTNTFRFDPEGNSSREVAVIVVTRAYELLVKETPINAADEHRADDQEEWNGGLIILDSEFAKDSYILEEIDGQSYIFLPYERFQYVFKMPDSGDYSFPDVVSKDGFITLEWKNKSGQVYLQIIMEMNSPVAYLNGEPVDMLIGPRMKGDEVFVPVNLFLQLFEMKSQVFQGRWCFQYPDDFPADILVGSWGHSSTNLFTGFKDMVTGVVSLPSFEWNLKLNDDGTYQSFMISCGGYQDSALFQRGKYKVIGNVIIFYDYKETLYKGTPLVLQYENRDMAGQLDLDFIEDYNPEEDKIELLFWLHRVESE